ncbi:MAG TPA: TonB-dependent receptor plug domain-containing protein, partial [Thermoanaerobaculia bacterium]|nr:TonB-dependent receptor plug domain-containing protein [Thermoanaerobaculia bacterium]
MARRVLIAVLCLTILAPTTLLLAQQAPDPPPGAPQKSDPKQDEVKNREDAKKSEEEKKKKDAAAEKIESLQYAAEVTVTATRVETDKMKTPVAVSTFDQDALDRKGIQTVKDLADLVPNMDISTINGQSTPIIALRGVRSTNETELGDPAVGVHLDGVYSPRMQGMLGLMFDNERVEVLRGPQGTLFGRNSTVGSINIISAKPDTAAYDSLVSMSFGNFNSRELQAMFNVPVSDTFALRVAGRIHDRDSYLDGYWDPNQYDQRYIKDLVAGAPTIAPGSFGDCTAPGCASRTQHSNWWIDWADGGADIRQLVRADQGDFYNNANEWAYRASALWKPIDDVSLTLSYQQ